MAKFSEDQIDFMRQDIASNFALSRIIETTKKMFKEQNRDFDKEFEEWKQNKERR